MEEQKTITRAMINLAKSEGKITSAQLAQEIKPLLDEFFVGHFTVKNNKILMSFFNGMNFTLTVN